MFRCTGERLLCGVLGFSLKSEYLSPLSEQVMPPERAQTTGSREALAIGQITGRFQSVISITQLQLLEKTIWQE